jgi:tetratricopeptide (TPR) repeat protein
MISKRIARTLAAAGLAALPSAPAAAQDAHQYHGIGGRLGKVEFKVDCAPAAQPLFNRAMALYHSFAWREAKEAFDAVLKADPACGMAHWGHAMVVLDNPFVWPASLSPAKLGQVQAALEAARKAGLKSQREKDYVEAVAAFVKDHEKVPHGQRLKAFEDAMEKLAKANGADKEATILYALVASANFNPADKTYANQLKAAKLLEPLFASQPDHPGVAHYIIHSYDYPPIAKHGVEAAKRYAAIAPDAPHALHMPSHIFTRLGHWQDSIVSNRTSAKVAASHKSVLNQVHAYDYMVYAHLQLGQDRAARQVITESLKIPEAAAAKEAHLAVAYAYAAMPARYTLERGAWKEAAAMKLQPAATAYPWDKAPQAEAVHVFAKGVGAARGGDAKGAREQHARLLALRDAAKGAGVPAFWIEQIEIQADVVNGLALCAEKKNGECLDALAKAATREDATEKHVVSPGPIVPAREVLAEMLYAQKKLAEALKEYEAVLLKEPNRYRAVAGAMQSARAAGDMAKARGYAEQLSSQGAKADSERYSLGQAKLMLAKR